MITAAALTGSERPVVSAHPALPRAVLSLALTVVASFAGAAPAAAHHGYEGRYDASRPLYLKGVVIDRSDGYPHGLIIIDPAPPTGPPDDLRSLDAADYEALGGRRVVSRARAVRATGSGEIALLLTPAMSTDVSELEHPPQRGDEVGALVFRECDTDELLVELLRLSARVRVVRRGVHGDVDGCKERVPAEDGWSDENGEQSATAGAGDEQGAAPDTGDDQSPAPDAADKQEPGENADRGRGASGSRGDAVAESVPVETVEPADTGGLPPLLLVAGVVGSGLAAFGGGLVAGRVRRRRR